VFGVRAISRPSSAAFDRGAGDLLAVPVVPEEIVARVLCLMGADDVAGSNVVDGHVGNLRIKLEDPWRNPRFIGAVQRKDYRVLALREFAT
jgi:hypothetical protein